MHSLVFTSEVCLWCTLSTCLTYLYNVWSSSLRPPKLDIWWAKRQLFEKRKLDHSNCCLHSLVFTSEVCLWCTLSTCLTYLYNVWSSSLRTMSRPAHHWELLSLTSDEQKDSYLRRELLIILTVLCIAWYLLLKFVYDVL